MSLWNRIVRLLKANVNDMVSKAEDPRKIMEQVLLEMKEQFQEAKKQVSRSVADEKLFAKKKEKSLLEANSWEKKAIQAVTAGDDRLAKAALTKKSHFEKLAQEYEKQELEQFKSVSQLKKALQLLQIKLDESERQKEVLLARQKRADAQKSIHQTVSRVLESSAYETLQKMAEKIEKAEAEAEAELELFREMQEQGLEERFRELEELSETQEDALDALKSRIHEMKQEEELEELEELEEEEMEEMLREIRQKAKQRGI